MSRVKTLLTGLAQNPGVLRSVIEDPRGFARLAGFSEAELCAMGGVGNAVSNLLNRLDSQKAAAPCKTTAAMAAVVCPRANGGRQNGGQAVAVTGIVSLLAVAGAVTAVGTVSLAALACRSEDQTA